MYYGVFTPHNVTMLFIVPTLLSQQMVYYAVHSAYAITTVLSQQMVYVYSHTVRADVVRL